jgi:Domain of unknown function (DUF1844)
MSQSEKPFTVSDKRHFTPEGRAREDAEPAAASEMPGAEAPAEETRAEPAEESPPRTPVGPADFSHFAAGLAAQAGALLSGEGLPEGVDAREALEGARSVIAILEMLEGKTAGNLSEPEAALLDELLFQLRMAYVGKTRTGGA